MALSYCGVAPGGQSSELLVRPPCPPLSLPPNAIYLHGFSGAARPAAAGQRNKTEILGFWPWSIWSKIPHKRYVEAKPARKAKLYRWNANSKTCAKQPSPNSICDSRIWPWPGICAAVLSLLMHSSIKCSALLAFHFSRAIDGKCLPLVYPFIFLYLSGVKGAGSPAPLHVSAQYPFHIGLVLAHDPTSAHMCPSTSCELTVPCAGPYLPDCFYSFTYCLRCLCVAPSLK